MALGVTVGRLTTIIKRKIQGNKASIRIRMGNSTIDILLSKDHFDTIFTLLKEINDEIKIGGDKQ